MRALYVPTPATSGGATYLVATAPGADTGGTLTRSSASSSSRYTLPLTRGQLRALLRQWAAADRDGRGLLELDD